MQNLISNLLNLGLNQFLTIIVEMPGSGVGHSAGAGSPFTDYTARVTVFVLLTGFLVATLLIGAFLVLNLGLMSKRKEDRVGGRNPSDLGVLKHVAWPEVPYEERALPAEEDEDEKEYERKKRSA